MSPSLVETFTLPLSAGILADFLSHQGIGAYFVGGVIRDSLLKIKTDDIDVAVEGNALIIGKAAASKLKGTYIELDRDRGICRVVVAGKKGFKVDFGKAFILFMVLGCVENMILFLYFSQILFNVVIRLSKFSVESMFSSRCTLSTKYPLTSRSNLFKISLDSMSSR